MKDKVRILLVGDAGVGKSSLITSLLKEKFEENVEAVVPEVTIPPEVTPEKVTTHIIDTSSRPEDREQVEQEILNADVVCVVYAVDNLDSFGRIASHWLPYIRQVNGVHDDSSESQLVPVILVGNKIDCRRSTGGDSVNHNLEQSIMPIMVQFKEVETCVECSAKELMNISEVFYFAQKAVLHPTAPLYDAREHRLKPECEVALKRIFALCDKDKDGLLSDDELNYFQQKCFNQPLQKKEIDGIKEVVLQGNPNGVDPQTNMLTEAGFLFLHQLFIQRGRLETTWTVLRKFGYGDDLRLRDDFLYPPLKVAPDQTVELSPKGMRFVYDLFMAHDRDRDSALSPAELSSLFATAVEQPWAENFQEGVATNAKNYVTLDGYLAQWVLMTLQEPRRAIACLKSLGYAEDDVGDTGRYTVPTMVKVTLSKKTELKRRHTTRTVFRCYVFGAKGSGKTTLLRSLAGKEPRLLAQYTSTTREQTAVGAVSIKGSEKYLTLREIPANGKDLEVLRSEKRMEDCDIAAFLYDASDPQSFGYVAELQRSMGSMQIPVLFVATKGEQDEVDQAYDVQPDEYTRQLDIQPPARLLLGQEDDVLVAVTEAAMNPHLNTPAEEEEGRDWLTLAAYAGAALAVGVAAAMAIRHMRKV
eukprot:comp23425_c0_seq1/m.38972 comp23425_c0_seq1/g.38972  ORF comp23425_c0_seq1/g.38972 comp23425_c0_seq1/m.38972 type:complete len:643 (-) comp23425_c0_seq1:268-2196(-)